MIQECDVVAKTRRIYLPIQELRYRDPYASSPLRGLRGCMPVLGSIDSSISPHLRLQGLKSSTRILRTCFEAPLIVVRVQR